MKKLIALYKAAKFIRDNKKPMEVLLTIKNLAKEVENEKKPKFQNIMKIGPDGFVYNYMSVWIGIGEITPIDRIAHLRNQNTEYKRLLQETLNTELPKELKDQIESTIRVFEL